MGLGIPGRVSHHNDCDSGKAGQTKVEMHRLQKLLLKAKVWIVEHKCVCGIDLTL